MDYKTDFSKLFDELDKKEISPDTLVSKQASKETIELFEYLKSIYGKKVLSGQQYLQSEELEDIVYWRTAGKLPAVRGYDLMDMDKKKGDDQVERAIRWAKDTGCIITMCWHWYAPDDMDDMENCCWSFYYKQPVIITRHPSIFLKQLYRAQKNMILQSHAQIRLL